MLVHLISVIFNFFFNLDISEPLTCGDYYVCVYFIVLLIVNPFNHGGLPDAYTITTIQCMEKNNNQTKVFSIKLRELNPIGTLFLKGKSVNMKHCLPAQKDNRHSSRTALCRA